jgi:sugar phosphate isomerase/epimerase
MSESNVQEPIAVANAPVSYGAFELTVGVEPGVPDGQSVLTQVAAAGYAGIDLGPIGYLGRGGELGEALARHRLGLAGAYVELPYSDPVALERALRPWPRPAAWPGAITRAVRCGTPRSGSAQTTGSASRPAWPW